MAKLTGKTVTDTLPDVNRISEYDENAKIPHFEGFYSPVNSEDEGVEMVRQQKDNFAQQGYRLFMFTDNSDGIYLGALKSNDEMDIVRWRGTDGINYDHTNADIVDKLKEWGSDNPIKVYGVSFDFVMFEFEKPVGDVATLAQQVYEFCPDAVDQGVGTLPDLEKSIQSSNSLFLWWD